ncbi:STAS domain-containing protein [Bacillus sp. J33]|uniref:STAS domain-containing protein n=1 Tax=Bacillus sp. J33 TaxID=935836 RepID=UPI00047D4010|nr:STAS domain-containing protein [Bacillus sp. J33]
MSHHMRLIGEKILKEKNDIAKRLHEERMSDVQMTEMQRRDITQIEQRVIRMRAEFIGLFGEALIDHTNKEKRQNKVEKWGKETGEYFFNLGVSLDEALKDASFYREHIWKAIEEIVAEHDMPASDVFKVIYLIDPLLDHAVYCFSLSYVQNQQVTLESAKQAFLELSVPVVPLSKGVGILPLIGNIDTDRAQLLMEETLKQSVNLKLSHLILDLSGVMIVDTMVADQLFKVIEALSLVGVQTIITGIRPEVAQTIVTLGINLNGIKVKANLYQAFEELHA